MSLPPPLPWSVRTLPERHLLLASAGFVLIGGLLWAAHEIGLSHPTCVLKGLTGLPCAGCGGTRAASFLFSGDVAGALAMNPGAVAAAAFAVLLVAYASAVLLLRLEPVRLPLLRRKSWRLAAVAALAANWVYLLLAGRT